jgi:hypothetical protein
MSTAKRTPEPGPKPKFQLVEHSLKCQTGDGEISLDTRISFERLELFMDMEGVEETKLPRFLLNEILSVEDRDTILALSDGVETFACLMEYAKSIGVRLKASMGESSGSSDSDETTEEPSGSTSPDSATTSTTSAAA